MHARGAESRCQKPPFLHGQARGLLAVGMIAKQILLCEKLYLFPNIFKLSWLDKASGILLEDSGELPEPEDLASEAVEHLQTALDELNDLILELESNNKEKNQ